MSGGPILVSIPDPPKDGGPYYITNKKTGLVLTVDKANLLQEGASISIQDKQPVGQKPASFQRFEYFKQDAEGYISTFACVASDDPASGFSNAFVRPVSDTEKSAIQQTHQPTVWKLLPIKGTDNEFNIQLLSEAGKLVLAHNDSEAEGANNVQLLTLADNDNFVWSFDA